ncbi:Cu(I)-responsive transcriptional regulator [Hyphobacterium sp. SN044]|uniref:Cu(I)-responsive transcriptional regulator n=1 Tax=Hyphobacterium sp. SN044 TaxID=2912575 RepID=UPI001F032B75|nr:Cu(I)-responsive transcriptional regulator [Hyphobacterium sp. SN044]MCF8880993.1 Cu(I)-responsive transcriptional regulator [Hyphobacterium sp. SN044]
MNIQSVAEMTGLPAKTIRYYEDIGLVAPKRSGNGYRVFDEAALARLNFVGRARSLGFSLDECRLLLGLWDDRARASSEVRDLARQHIGEIDRKLAELRDMRRTLSELVQSCHGDDRPNCPIIETLSGDETSTEE